MHRLAASNAQPAPLGACAVLLEHRVLLRCRHYRLMVLVAETLRQLLYPFAFLHVYIPVLPYVLLDYIEVTGGRPGSEAVAAHDDPM